MFSDRLEKITNCLLQCEEDHLANIRRLTALCGEELGATCALYNRLEGDLLCSLGQWQTPQDFKASDSPEGHICYDVIRGDCNDAVLIRDLPATHYAETDPNVLTYSLQTYLGHAVMSEGKAVGSLCVVYQTDYIPAEDDKRFLKFIASAIGYEDTRWKSKEALDLSVSLLKQAEAALVEEKAFTENALNILQDVFFVFDPQGRFLRWNKAISEITNYSDDEISLMKPTDFFLEEEHERVSEGHPDGSRGGFGIA